MEQEKRLRIFRYIPLIFLAVLTGCSTGTNYWQNRLDDAADIFSAGIGNGFGVKVQAGPVYCGPIYTYAEWAGIRGGEAYLRPERHWQYYHVCEGSYGNCFPFLNREIFVPDENAVLRNKAYSGSAPLIPFLILHQSITKNDCNTCCLHYMRARYQAEKESGSRLSAKETAKLNNAAETGGPEIIAVTHTHPWYFYSDINAAAGCIYAFRFGFNAGELLDFLAGFFFLDFYEDDL